MARTVGNDEHAMNNVRYDNIARLLKNPLPFSDGLFLRFAQRAKSRKQGGRWLTLGWEGRDAIYCVAAWVGTPIPQTGRKVVNVGWEGRDAIYCGAAWVGLPIPQARSARARART